MTLELSVSGDTSRQILPISFLEDCVRRVGSVFPKWEVFPQKSARKRFGENFRRVRREGSSFDPGLRLAYTKGINLDLATDSSSIAEKNRKNPL